MKIKLGTYVGTGSAITINGIGFAPDYILIKGDDTQSAIFTQMTLAGNASINYRDNATTSTTMVTSRDSDGFTVGTSAFVNTNTKTYYYACFKSMDSGALYIGADRGTGTAHSIILPSLINPKLVMGKTESTASGIWRTDQNSTNTAMNFYGGAGQTNDLLSFAAGAISIGTGGESNNAGGALYHYMVMADAPTIFTTGSYTGTGAANSITLPWTPAIIFVGTETNGVGGSALWMSTMATNKTGTFDATALFAGGITSVVNNVVNLGTSGRVNSSGVTYKYAAWKLPPSGRATANIPRTVIT